MAALTWKWEDFWGWFSQIENDSDKAIAWKELLGDGWMKNLTPQNQAIVLCHAPVEILNILKHFPDTFKYDTLIILDREINKGRKR